MVRQFMVSIPDDLIEAARIDGASEFDDIPEVVVPLSKPIIAVLVIFTFMWRWNDFALPLVVLTNQDMFTVQLGLNLLRGQLNTGMDACHGHRAVVAAARCSPSSCCSSGTWSRASRARG